MKVSYEETVEEFVTHGTTFSREQFAEWESKCRLIDSGVVSFVKGFTHEHLFSVSRAEFQRVTRETVHPLGNVNPKNSIDKQAIALVANVDTPWSFMQLFHDYVETKKCVPTWQALKKWLTTDAKARLWEPYQEQLHWKKRDAKARHFAGRGIQWRWGNMYYSALRELDILIGLRDMEVQLKYHVLADALFAVDFWKQKRLVSVYIPHSQYKDDQEGGRKRRPEVTFAGSSFEYGNFPIRKRKDFGVYWPVAAETLNDIAQFATGMRPS